MVRDLGIDPKGKRTYDVDIVFVPSNSDYIPRQHVHVLVYSISFSLYISREECGVINLDLHLEFSIKSYKEK